MGKYNIEQMSNDINEKLEKLKAMIKAKQECDFERMEKVVELALRSLSLKKIWNVKRKVFNDDIEEGGDDIYKATYEYFEAGKGQALKGVKILEKKGENFSEDFYQRNEHCIELWLTNKGFMETELVGLTVTSAFSESNLSRTIIDKDVDIFAINEDLDYIWDIEDIIKSIDKKMNDRVIALDKKITLELQRREEMKNLL